MSAEIAAGGDLQGFFHVRVLIGLVTGLSVTRILNGLARFVQHPSRNAVYPPHLAWSAFMLIFVIHYWWFEFGLMAVPKWQFQNYLFVLFYAATIFFISTLLYPDRMEDYSGFEAYFQSRRGWFYGFLALLFVIDTIDTAVKGREHFLSFGLEYPVRQTILFGLAVAGIFVPKRNYHLSFAIGACIAELWWIFSRFRFLD